MFMLDFPQIPMRAIFPCFFFFVFFILNIKLRRVSIFTIMILGFAEMPKPKTEFGKKNDLFREAVFDQFIKVPQPSREEALKAIRGLKLKSKVQVRDFDKW
jgi:hypothetical protein